MVSKIQLVSFSLQLVSVYIQLLSEKSSVDTLCTMFQKSLIVSYRLFKKKSTFRSSLFQWGGLILQQPIQKLFNSQGMVFLVGCSLLVLRTAELPQRNKVFVNHNHTFPIMLSKAYRHNA